MSKSIWGILAEDAEAMALEAFKEVTSLEEWERIRPVRHQEFLHSLGLNPLPERCDLKLTEHGCFEGDGFSARKISFQILPDCWASACVYYPDPIPATRAPGVLYVCGHATIGTFGYQTHPIMWARRGYVCLILDTIEQNDNPGEHHGSSMGKSTAWLSLGYTPAGGEVWNAMRALDVLAGDPRVDPERLGVTGVSGGGACSFFLAAVDERLKAVSTLCGISSPRDAVCNRHLFGHCDCMYPHNVYGRDISEYAALLAPRAALFCFAENDPLFHLEETRALAERTRTIYRLHGEEARCELTTCPGPHGDHREFDEATSRWFDRYVAGEGRPPIQRGARELPESVTTVYNGQTPGTNRLSLLPHLLSTQRGVPLPKGADEWPELRRGIVENLRREIFPLCSRRRDFSMRHETDWCYGGGSDAVTAQEHRGQVGGIEVRLLLQGLPNRRQLVVCIAGEGETAQNAKGRAGLAVDRQTTTLAAFEPRLAADRSPEPERYDAPPGSRLMPVRTSLLRAMAITGTTPVMMTMEDIAHIVDYLLALPAMKESELYLYGKGEAGVAALYASILDERIAGVVVEDAPASHLEGGPILGILRLFDMPQAVGLMAPRKIALVNPVSITWTWPTRVYERLGCPGNFVIAEDARTALEKLTARP